MSGGACNESFAKWDAVQEAPVRVEFHDEDAVLVLQDKVLGAGRVAFSTNNRAFQDFYEDVRYGTRLLGWLLGQEAAEHRKNVEKLRGGPGDLVRRH